MQWPIFTVETSPKESENSLFKSGNDQHVMISLFGFSPRHNPKDPLSSLPHKKLYVNFFLCQNNLKFKYPK